jgi:hypothetical protein
MVVPTTARVNGKIAINNMINGIDLTRFTIMPKIKFTGLHLQIPFLSVIYKMTPTGIPTT